MQLLDCNLSPERVLAAWPAATPLAALVTGSAHPRWGRTTMIAAPDRFVEAHGAGEAIEALESAAADGGTWIVSACYELGAAFEPSALPRRRAPADGWPLVTLARCDARLELDHGTGRWSASPAAEALSREVADRAAGAGGRQARAAIEGLEADIGRAEFEAMVRRAVDLVHAGDVFQANVAQRFSARWTGSPRAVLAAALDAARPRYGAYLESGPRALVSMSPELFLDVDRRAGRAVTRPVKGTRASHEDAEDLVRSGKDAAELHMIVDLMRNDLGRVARAGGVRVRDARSVETHATVHHGVAEVEADLCPGTGPVDVLRAAFPPGSVTGAPKVRAMQVIDGLEPCARGPYCGAIGLLSPDRMALSVAIRTICMLRTGTEGGILRYSAGCGIVAESDPAHEYQESLHKSAVLLRTAHALTATGAARGS